MSSLVMLLNPGLATHSAFQLLANPLVDIPRHNILRNCYFGLQLQLHPLEVSEGHLGRHIQPRKRDNKFVPATYPHSQQTKYAIYLSLKDLPCFASVRLESAHRTIIDARRAKHADVNR